MKVQLTSAARRRLQQIRDYHRKSGNPAKGRKVTSAILKRAKELEDYPYLGPEEENFKKLNQGHRYLLVGKLYKIIYLVIKPIIFITDIFNTRQDPDDMKP